MNSMINRKPQSWISQSFGLYHLRNLFGVAVALNKHSKTIISLNQLPNRCLSLSSLN